VRLVSVVERASHATVASSATAEAHVKEVSLVIPFEDQRNARLMHALVHFMSHPTRALESNS
jgi:hypothetical protein